MNVSKKIIIFRSNRIYDQIKHRRANESKKSGEFAIAEMSIILTRDDKAKKGNILRRKRGGGGGGEYLDNRKRIKRQREMVI